MVLRPCIYHVYHTILLNYLKLLQPENLHLLLFKLFSIFVMSNSLLDGFRQES